MDCVVLGFDGIALKVLLTKKKYPIGDAPADELKLPGSMMLDNETLPEAAIRVLYERIGLTEKYLQQTSIFSNPNRVNDDEIKWICNYHHIKTDRVVMVGYYALIKLDKGLINYSTRMGATWKNVDDIHHLIMDHVDFLSDALNILQKEMTYSTIAESFQCCLWRGNRQPKFQEEVADLQADCPY